MDAIYKLIKLNRFVQSHRVKFAPVLAAHMLGIRHLFVRLDPIMACNLRCTMCYFTNDEYRKQIKGEFTEQEINRIAELFFSRTVQLVIGCGTEPTLYKNFPELVRIARKHKVPFVGFTSNGQLLTEEHISKFIDYGLDELTLSAHGVEKETYERFMGRASFERFHQVLRMITEAKRMRGSSTPHLRINYTANAENLPELRSFFDVFGEYDVQTVQVRPIIDFEGSYRQLLQSNDLALYSSVIERLTNEARARGVTLLADRADPMYSESNKTSVILQAVLRRITPMEVWQPDFHWREENYMEYCKRIGWSKHLARLIVSSIDEVRGFNAGKWGDHAAKYDVIS
jgi:GTP 3',8-cyclase